MADPIDITGLDHLVLTVADIDATCAFYRRALGMRVERFGAGRFALHFGTQKINLHGRGAEVKPNAANAQPGSADLCFITTTPIDQVSRHLRACAIAIEHGPVAQTGARGAMESVYFRDPDGNLIEVARYPDAQSP